MMPRPRAHLQAFRPSAWQPAVWALGLGIMLPKGTCKVRARQVCMWACTHVHALYMCPHMRKRMWPWTTGGSEPPGLEGMSTSSSHVTSQSSALGGHMGACLCACPHMHEAKYPAGTHFAQQNEHLAGYLASCMCPWTNGFKVLGRCDDGCWSPSHLGSSSCTIFYTKMDITARIAWDYWSGHLWWGFALHQLLATRPKYWWLSSTITNTLTDGSRDLNPHPHTPAKVMCLPRSHFLLNLRISWGFGFMMLLASTLLLRWKPEKETHLQEERVLWIWTTVYKIGLFWERTPNPPQRGPI